MNTREYIYRDAKQILDDSKQIKPYVIICQPRRDLKETPAQNFEGIAPHINLCGFSHAFANIGGEKVDVARNYLIECAIQSGAKYMFFIGEDTVIPYDGFLKLHKTCEENPGTCAVGVYYIKLSETPMIMIKDNDWIVPADVTPEKNAFPIWQAGMDAMLIPVEILQRMKSKEPENPYCCIVNDVIIDGETIPFIGEDNYFYNRLHKMGVKILCNTNVQCLHMDIATGKYTAHSSIDLSNYRTLITPTEVLTEKDREHIDKRWVDRLPKGTE